MDKPCASRRHRFPDRASQRPQLARRLPRTHRPARRFQPPRDRGVVAQPELDPPRRFEVGQVLPGQGDEGVLEGLQVGHTPTASGASPSTSKGFAFPSSTGLSARCNLHCNEPVLDKHQFQSSTGLSARCNPVTVRVRGNRRMFQSSTGLSARCNRGATRREGTVQFVSILNGPFGPLQHPRVAT